MNFLRKTVTLRKYFPYFLLIFLCSRICGCRRSEGGVRGKSDNGPAYGDILVEGAIGDGSNLIPLVASESTWHGIDARVYNGLVKYLAEEQPYAFLCVPDALPIIDPRFRGLEPAPLGIDHDFIKCMFPKKSKDWL